MTSFEGEVDIVIWQTGQLVTTQMPVIEALPIMARSTRFDTQHCTAAVRILDTADAINLGLIKSEDTPVFFRHRKTKRNTQPYAVPRQ